MFLERAFVSIIEMNNLYSVIVENVVVETNNIFQVFALPVAVFNVFNLE